MSGAGGPWAVLYDGHCGFCRWSLALLLVADRRQALRPLALGGAEANRLLADLEPAERLSSWHLVAPGGERLSAGAALPAAVALLPGGRLPAAALRRFPGATERGYRWVAEHRTLLSRLLPSRAKRWGTSVLLARKVD